MELLETGCCAVTEIAQLSHHRNAEEAMLAFCEQTRDYDYNDDTYWIDRWGNDHERERTKLMLSGHYIFTGVVNQGKTYGQDFRAFIRRHGLGRVTESASARNRLNHPENAVRVWVWQPSPKALNRWWRKQTGK